MQFGAEGEKQYVDQQLESTLDSVDQAEISILEAATTAGFR